jgi:hypothetical protein
MRMPHTVVCGLPVSTVFFHLLSHKRHDFRKTVIERKMRVLILPSILSATFLSLRRNERDMIKNVYRDSGKIPFILSDFNET